MLFKTKFNLDKKFDYTFNSKTINFTLKYDKSNISLYDKEETIFDCTHYRGSLPLIFKPALPENLILLKLPQPAILAPENKTYYFSLPVGVKIFLGEREISKVYPYNYKKSLWGTPDIGKKCTEVESDIYEKIISADDDIYAILPVFFEIKTDQPVKIVHLLIETRSLTIGLKDEALVFSKSKVVINKDGIEKWEKLSGFDKSLQPDEILLEPEIKGKSLIKLIFNNHE